MQGCILLQSRPRACRTLSPGRAVCWRWSVLGLSATSTAVSVSRAQFAMARSTSSSFSATASRLQTTEQCTPPCPMRPALHSSEADVVLSGHWMTSTSTTRKRWTAKLSISFGSDFAWRSQAGENRVLRTEKENHYWREQKQAAVPSFSAQRPGHSEPNGAPLLENICKG